MRAVIVDLLCNTPYYCAPLVRALRDADVGAVLASPRFYLEPRYLDDTPRAAWMLDLAVHASRPRPLRLAIRAVEATFNLALLLARVASGAYDVVHVQWIPFEERSSAFMRVLRRACRATDTLLVYTAHNAIPHDRPSTDVSVIRRNLDLADLVIAQTSHVAAELADVVGTVAPIEVIAHGPLFTDRRLPDRVAAADRLGIDSSSPIVLCLGLLRPYKGLDLLADAWPAVRAAVPDARLLVVGKRGDRDVDTDIDRLRHLPGVTVEERYVSVPAMLDYHAVADVVVVPYRRISQSGALMTAVGLGRPVVVTPIEGLLEQVAGLESAVIAADLSGRGLADAIVSSLGRTPELDAAAARDRDRIAASATGWRSVGGDRGGVRPWRAGADGASRGRACRSSRAMSGSAIRVGVVTSGLVAAWQARCVDELAATPGVSIARWLERTPTRSGNEQASSGARSSVAVPEALAVLRDGSPEAEPGSRTPDGADANGAVEILIDLTAEASGRPVWAGEVWRFGYGPTLTRDAPRAALVDYVRAAGKTRVGLIAEPAGSVIRDGWLQTGTWWRGELLDHLLMDVASWPATAILERMAHGTATAIPPTGDGGTGATGGTVAIGRTADEAPPTDDGTRTNVPAPLLVIGAVGRRILGAADTVLRQPDWNIGVVDAPIDGVLAAGFAPRITWLPARAGHFAADPFGVDRGGVLHVLFEDFDQVGGIGSIQHVSIAGNGEVSVPQRVLETPGHASYPFLIEHAGSIFMLPETSSADELVLYEADPFPGRWRPVRALLSGVPAVDASVVHHEGRWWMFATRIDRGDNHNLFVWHAAELDGPWLAHRANPVKTDVRSTRPGGTPFVHDGALYRPAQDCSRVYGGRIVVNRIDVLAPDAFVERPVAVLEPRPQSPYPDGLHTLSAAGRRTMIDGNRNHLVGDATRRTVGRRLRRFRAPRPPEPRG